MTALLHNSIWNRRIHIGLPVFILFFIHSTFQQEIGYGVSPETSSLGIFNITNFSTWTLKDTKRFADINVLYGVTIHPYTQDIYVVGASSITNSNRRLFKINPTNWATSRVSNSYFPYATKLAFSCENPDAIVVQSRKSVWSVNINSGTTLAQTQISFYDRCDDQNQNSYALCYNPNERLFIRSLDSGCNNNNQIGYYNLSGGNSFISAWSNPVSSRSQSFSWSDCMFVDKLDSTVILNENYLGYADSSKMPEDMISVVPSGYTSLAVQTLSCCPDKCNYHGKCLTSKTCQCESGFIGPYCTTPEPITTSQENGATTNSNEIVTDSSDDVIITTNSNTIETTTDGSDEISTESSVESSSESSTGTVTSGNQVLFSGILFSTTKNENSIEDMNNIADTSAGTNSDRKINIAVIVGPVFAVIVIGIMIGVILLLFVNKRKRKEEYNNEKKNNKNNKNKNIENGVATVDIAKNNNQKYQQTIQQYQIQQSQSQPQLQYQYQQNQQHLSSNNDTLASKRYNDNIIEERYSQTLDVDDINAIFGSGAGNDSNIIDHNKSVHVPVPIEVGDNGNGTIGESWIVPYYELSFENQIGKGAYGIVYKGKWKTKSVAIKQIRTNHMTTEERISIISEMKALISLKQHQNIVTMLGICKRPLSLISEFMERGNLFDYLHSEGSIAEIVLFNIVTGVARGILHLHNQGLCHRDLTSRNVLLTSFFKPQITDYGIVKYSKTDIDNSNIPQGTLRALAPEVINNQIFTTKSDVWSFGILMCEIFSRKIPYDNIIDDQIVAAQVSKGEIRCDIPVNCSQDIQLLIHGCTQYLISQRPSFETICETLEAIKL